MSALNSTTPLARRAVLADRVEQLKRMVEIRLAEERIQRLFSEGEVRGSTHLCIGQEAVAVGLARPILKTLFPAPIADTATHWRSASRPSK